MNIFSVPGRIAECPSDEAAVSDAVLVLVTIKPIAVQLFTTRNASPNATHAAVDNCEADAVEGVVANVAVREIGRNGYSMISRPFFLHAFAMRSAQSPPRRFAELE